MIASPATSPSNRPPGLLPLAGHRGVVLGRVLGPANGHGIAWGCARSLRARGASLVLTGQGDKARPPVQPLADAIGAPLSRLVTLDEVGGCVAFLVGPDASGMTGPTLFIDAGAHALR